MKIKSYSHILIIVVLSLSVYLNTFQSPFHFDDETAIMGNVDLKSWEGINKYSFISRYVLFLSFYLNYLLGEFNVVGYHAVNILLHISVCILIYLIIDLTLRDSEPLKYSSMKNIPLLSAIIFSVHPIHTESVTYIISRSSILATFFYLFSLFLFILFSLQGKGDYQFCKDIQDIYINTYYPFNYLFTLHILYSWKRGGYNCVSRDFKAYYPMVLFSDRTKGYSLLLYKTVIIANKS